MTIYTGETVRVRTSATGYNGAAITEDDVTDVTMEFFDSTGESLFTVSTASGVTYDTLNGRWYYDWHTDIGVQASPVPTVGAYKVKVYYHGGTAFDSWEYLTVRLKRNPVS